MPLTLVKKRTEKALPVHCIPRDGVELADLSPSVRRWAAQHGFRGEGGRVLTYPGADGELAGALLGTGSPDDVYRPMLPGRLARELPEGEWYFATAPEDEDLGTLALLMGGYVFGRYGKESGREIRFAVPGGVDDARATRIGGAVSTVRDLVNTPANDMGPDALERAARDIAGRHGVSVSVIAGDTLLEAGFPMIHAVGRASPVAPRLLDFSWGPQDAPKVTLVGKGVCFDTGGLDIKPPSSMLNMKKDMGGAANVLGLADMIMGAGMKLRLRVLVPAVENSIAGDAFRPGDVLPSRKGLTVEIGNTDAEGRLVLADALSLADEEAPDLLIDMATLTGAARVALGADLPPFFTDDERLAGELAGAAAGVCDPLWRLPLWRPYAAKLSSKVADMNNVTTDGLAGAVTAALFLRRFVEKARSWAHFDIFAWNPQDRPHGPTGGEAQAIRAIERVLSDRYG